MAEDNEEHQLIATLVSSLNTTEQQSTVNEHQQINAADPSINGVSPVNGVTVDENDEHTLIVNNARKLSTVQSSDAADASSSQGVSRDNEENAADWLTAETTTSTTSESVDKSSSNEQIKDEEHSAIAQLTTSLSSVDQLRVDREQVSNEAIDSQVAPVSDDASSGNLQKDGDEHSTIGQLLSTLNATKTTCDSLQGQETNMGTESSQTVVKCDTEAAAAAASDLSAVNNRVDESPQQSPAAQVSQVKTEEGENETAATLSQQTTCPSSLLKSEERLAEQRLTVLQLLADMSSDEPSITANELLIEEFQLVESTITESSTTSNEPPSTTGQLQQPAVTDEVNITTNSVDADSEHHVIAQHTAQLAEAETSALPNDVNDKSNEDNTQPVADLDTRNVISHVVINSRQTGDEHRLIAQYTSNLTQKDGTQANDEVTLHVSNTASDSRRQLLEQLQARNLELKQKIARLKQVQQARDDVTGLLQENEKIHKQILSLQEKRIEMTSKRDDLMKQLKTRNTLWRSPTVSQAGSELSINTYDDQSSSVTTPLTTGSGTFSFPQSDDVTNTEQQRRQIEELHEQLRQMMTSSANDDAIDSFPVQFASKSSSFLSSERTITVTAEVTSITTSSRVTHEGEVIQVTQITESETTTPGVVIPSNTLDQPQGANEVADSKEVSTLEAATG